jgi:Holliday junction resolvasome RuvABC endonuclease subunit
MPISKSEERLPIKEGENVNLYAGLDLSLTGTGVIVIDEEAKILYKKLISTTTQKIIEQRIIDITYEVFLTIPPYSTTYIEGLAFGARGISMLELAALHYFVRIKYLQNKEKYKIVGPGTVKKFVTGKGSAKKEMMLLNVFKKWGESFDDNNLCDAYSLARLALHESKPKPKKTTQLKLRAK